jgi:hypothetical protein
MLGLGIGGLETDYLRPGERARESRRVGEPASERGKMATQRREKRGERRERGPRVGNWRRERGRGRGEGEHAICGSGALDRIETSLPNGVWVVSWCIGARVDVVPS